MNHHHHYEELIRDLDLGEKSLDEKALIAKDLLARLKQLGMRIK